VAALLVDEARAAFIGSSAFLRIEAFSAFLLAKRALDSIGLAKNTKN